MPQPPVVPPAGSVTVYATSWCSYCASLRAGLADAGVPFREVDVEADAGAAAFVEQANGGDRLVPTVVFPDGAHAANPTIGQVRARLGG